MKTNFKIRYINQKNLNDFISGKYEENAFVMMLYYNEIRVKGLDHIDIGKSQVKVHHRDVAGGYIIRGSENLTEYDHENILS